MTNEENNVIKRHEALLKDLVKISNGMKVHKLEEKTEAEYEADMNEALEQL